MRQATGTTHGTPYNYDAHIPLDPDGRAHPARRVLERTSRSTISHPTLATLVKVEIPGGSSGRVLNEAFRPAAATAPGCTQ